MRKLTTVLILILPAATAIGSISISIQDGISGLTSNSVIDIAHDSLSIWLGSGGGAAVTFDDGETWTLYGEDHGLPGNEVSALAGNDRGVWVATSHSETVSGGSVPIGDGISLTTDGGASWETFTPKQVTWPGMLSYDLAAYDSILFSACFYGGLIRSTDFGVTWENLYPSQLDSINSDSVDFNNDIFNRLTNRFFSVQVDTTAFPDTFSVWGGSAAGITRFFFTTWNAFDWHRYVSWDGDVARISGGSTSNTNDDWLISAGVDFSGATACTLFFRHYYEDYPAGNEDSALVMLSDDGGLSWPETLAVFTNGDFGGFFSPDSQWIDISSFAAGKDSISVAFLYVKGVPSFVDNGGNWQVDDITFSADDSVLMNESFDGEWGPYGDHPPAGWTILDNDGAETFNTFPDSIYHITRDDTTVTDSLKLPGNFVVALGVQMEGSSERIWAACRPAFSGSFRVAYSDNDGASWHQAPIGGISNTVEGWDFSFADDTVYVATGDGLYMSSGDYSSWTLLSGFVDLDDQTFYQDNAPFFAVDVVDGVVWGGGSDGVVRSLPSGEWDVFRSGREPENHYAYPSPFSPFQSTRKGTTIHFKPASDTRATIGIYDINLESVKTVVSGIFRRGGVESDDIVWDGTNDDSELVANGVYFYRIELDSGDDLWGKVVVVK